MADRRDTLDESPRMQGPSLLFVTCQDRVLKLAGLGFFAGIGIIYLGGARFVTERFTAALAIALFGAAVAVSSALFALYRIRCPRCHLPWLRWAMRNRPANDWLPWLLRFSECPGCARGGH